MTRLFTLILSVIFSQCLIAQCECPALPDDQTGKTVVTVSTVSELQNALSNCNADGGNYTILLEDGTYELNDDLLYINQSMTNLTIRSLSGNRDAVIIQGQGYDGNVQYIFNVAASHFTLADVTIGWVMYHGIQIHAEHDADFCLIQNVRFVDIQEQMLKVSGSNAPTFSDGGLVQCCLFEFTSGVGHQWYTGGIDAHRAKDWEVRNNTFKHIRSPDSGLAEHAIHFWSGSENTLVENNLIIDCDRGIGFGLGSSQHFGGIIRNNFVHTSRDVGIGMESSPDTKVYHNTVITDNYFNSIEYRFEETMNVHIANNLTDKDVKSRNGGTGNIESNFETTDQSIFEDASNYDYHLSNAAHADIIDAGVELAEVSLDYDCHHRSTGGTPDIGADEFNSMFSNDRDIEDFPQVQIYPNPASDLLFISNEKPLEVTLYNLQGQRIKFQKIETGINEIDISGFATGIYVLEVNSENRVMISKLIKE